MGLFRIDVSVDTNSMLAKLDEIQEKAKELKRLVYEFDNLSDKFLAFDIEKDAQEENSALHDTIQGNKNYLRLK